MSIVDKHRALGERFVGAFHVEIPEIGWDSHFDIRAFVLEKFQEESARTVLGKLLTTEELETKFGPLIRGDGSPD